MKVAVIEKDRVGHMFHVGCIQSKLLIEHGKRVYEMNQAKDWGIFANHIELDINKMNHRGMRWWMRLLAMFTIF